MVARCGLGYRPAMSRAGRARRSAVVRQCQLSAGAEERYCPGTSAGVGRSGRPSSASAGRWRFISSETEIRSFRVDMPTGRRTCSWRRRRPWRAIGRPSMTDASSRPFPSPSTAPRRSRPSRPRSPGCMANPALSFTPCTRGATGWSWSGSTSRPRAECVKGAALAGLRSALDAKLSSGLDAQVRVPDPAGNAQKGVL
jgi:hypothetical protein